MPTLRYRLAALIGALGLLTAALLAGPVAQAQSYPPGSSVPSCTPGNVNAGTVHVGQSVNLTLCAGFAAGVTITITVNGTVVLTKTPTNGAIIVVVTVLSTTVLVVGDPVNAPALCGTNTVVATGAGSSAVATGTFDLACTTSTTNGGTLAFTGTDAAGLILLALLLLGAGTVIVLTMRRRRDREQTAA